MAYKIRYSEIGIIRTNKFTTKIKKKHLVKWCLVIILVGLLCVNPIRKVFIPGDAAITKSAFAAFTSDLEEGRSFSEAAVDFCRYIIESDRFE